MLIDVENRLTAALKSRMLELLGKSRPAVVKSRDDNEPFGCQVGKILC